ncbi:MAG: hypothetical protein JST06_03085 [Bacteroidetes bacterium]|nr:hypothetical protein [Bacteroidota bacterium]MBS1628808.1 hypothetical protein [Bacteroidota bacterium]
MANKVEVFSKIKEVHGRSSAANPQILVSVIMRELHIDAEEADRHLSTLQTLGLTKFKGATRAAVELTRSGLTTTMRLANPLPEEAELKKPERV